MARSNSGSTSNFFNLNSAIISGPPLTISCWLNEASTAGVQVFVALSNSAHEGGDLLGLYTFTGAVHVVHQNSTGTAGDATSTLTIGTNAWHNVIGVFASDSSRTIFVDGANSASNSTTVSAYSFDRTFIGAWEASGPNIDPINGSVAEVCFWNVTLTNSEVAALSRGVNARYIRPLSIIGYWPLWGLIVPEPDMSGSKNSMIVSGTMNPANHAPVTLWTPKRITAPLIGAAVAGVKNLPPFQRMAA